MISRVASLFCILFFATSCDDLFLYSLYEAKVPVAHRNTTEKNLKRIYIADSLSDIPFKVAVITDTHYHLDKLTRAVELINANQEIHFTVVVGDLTDQGLLFEYLAIQKALDKLKRPYFTVIGNHDYLLYGGSIYSQMFGPYNYSFTYRKVKFIVFDDVFLESNAIPDFDWFSDELRNNVGYHHIIPLVHIPPGDAVQFPEHYQQLYIQLMVENGVRLSVHGHGHEFTLGEPYADGVLYLTASSPQKRSFSELTITPSSIEVERIKF